MRCRGRRGQDDLVDASRPTSSMRAAIEAASGPTRVEDQGAGGLTSGRSRSVTVTMSFMERQVPFARRTFRLVRLQPVGTAGADSTSSGAHDANAERRSRRRVRPPRSHEG